MSVKDLRSLRIAEALLAFQAAVHPSSLTQTTLIVTLTCGVPMTPDRLRETASS